MSEIQVPSCALEKISNDKSRGELDRETRIPTLRLMVDDEPRRPVFAAIVLLPS